MKVQMDTEHWGGGGWGGAEGVQGVLARLAAT